LYTTSLCFARGNLSTDSEKLYSLFKYAHHLKTQHPVSVTEQGANPLQTR